jgi:hypothetical protein
VRSVVERLKLPIKKVLSGNSGIAFTIAPLQSAYASTELQFYEPMKQFMKI